ncbi:Uma2 family endonuclease [Streptomyces sp. SID4919]|uniref:Uma2 family endonuclease n=1 Tax=Streptomyces sp. SID4919 TaxID=2690270 RepID=UPI000823B2A9|nr:MULTISPECIES: Uma2 family endonuclease [unclassified Streptomyces]MYY12738.1 Uma2 family endonuclease [Streptomyces sp. SID4919]SCK21019.1 Endonuclease, Uma2 family (restriction endonuclease fold) [Streptomyces sp. AmelKG-E11A]
MNAERDYGLDEHYEWARPPVGGWVADDLDKLPNLPPHTELIDGSLVLVSPQTLFHTLVMSLLDYTLRVQVPDHLMAVREMPVRLDRRNRPEPDVMVVLREALFSGDQTSFDPDQVVLAVEVVSEDSRERDREAKPRKYAGAGIPHYWRVEKNDGLPVVYVYELDPATNSYVVTGIHHDKLELTVPFDVEIDLTALDRRPGTP